MSNTHQNQYIDVVDPKQAGRVLELESITFKACIRQPVAWQVGTHVPFVFVSVRSLVRGQPTHVGVSWLSSNYASFSSLEIAERCRRVM